MFNWSGFCAEIVQIREVKKTCCSEVVKLGGMYDFAEVNFPSALPSFAQFKYEKRT